MKEAAILQDEDLRLKELQSYNILDTEGERDFDQLVELATLICQSEISLVTLIDKDRQWFKARKGLSIHETPRQVSFCAHTILQDEVFVVHDAAEDERFWDNPLVTDAPHIRFYAGAPIVSESGFNLGTVCVIDKRN
jgi:GAF domain-containing protein